MWRQALTLLHSVQQLQRVVVLLVGCRGVHILRTWGKGGVRWRLVGAAAAQGLLLLVQRQ